MEWLITMPKVELHAHLNGSIRDATLLELARILGDKHVIVFEEVEHVIHKNDRSLSEVFKLFDLIHILTTDHKTVTRITKEVVEDFASETVAYLELRTTPKRNDGIGMSKRSYMEAVLEGLKAVQEVDVDFAASNSKPDGSISKQMDCNATTRNARKKIYVRLLLSIDRKETPEAAMETVKLAFEMRDLGVVGIDLSGNPLVGEWKTFLPALRFARDQGLYITLHAGEVSNSEEIKSMLDFCPNRFGHACWFGDEDWKRVKASRIPIEICLTSNIRTETISSIDIHHFADLYGAKHPLALCTDDSGVFSTSLSKEFNLASSTFGLSKKEIFELSKGAIELIFADEAVKQELKKIFSAAANTMEL